MTWISGNNFRTYKYLCLIHISEILLFYRSKMNKIYFSYSIQQQKYMNKVNECVCITFLVIMAQFRNSLMQEKFPFGKQSFKMGKAQQWGSWGNSWLQQQEYNAAKKQRGAGYKFKACPPKAHVLQLDLNPKFYKFPKEYPHLGIRCLNT